MDPLSQAVVGGVAAGVFAREKRYIKPAIICGALAGMAPDLDIFIRSADDPMFTLQYHRHFTHSLAFVPFGALLVAAFLWLFARKKIGFSALYLFCFAGYASHGILDAMTNYGTHLFWPFTSHRESWSIISIIDPLFTLPVLGLLIAATKAQTRKYVAIAMAFMLSYWSFGAYQQAQATEAMMAQAKTRGHVVERHEVKPSFANLFAWRAQYLHNEVIYVDAYHVSPWNGQRVYEGGSLPLYIPGKIVSERQKQDVAYFTFFSDGWVAYTPKHPNVIGDVRFSMLPHKADPIWGIILQPNKPDAHVRFKNIRNREEGDIGMLWKMIIGAPL